MPSGKLFLNNSKFLEVGKIQFCHLNEVQQCTQTLSVPFIMFKIPCVKS